MTKLEKLLRNPPEKTVCTERLENGQKIVRRVIDYKLWQKQIREVIRDE